MFVLMEDLGFFLFNIKSSRVKFTTWSVCARFYAEKPYMYVKRNIVSEQNNQLQLNDIDWLVYF